MPKGRSALKEGINMFSFLRMLSEVFAPEAVPGLFFRTVSFLGIADRTLKSKDDFLENVTFRPSSLYLGEPLNLTRRTPLVSLYSRKPENQQKKFGSIVLRATVHRLKKHVSLALNIGTTFPTSWPNGL